MIVSYQKDPVYSLYSLVPRINTKYVTVSRCLATVAACRSTMGHLCKFWDEYKKRYCTKGKKETCPCLFKTNHDKSRTPSPECHGQLFDSAGISSSPLLGLHLAQPHRVDV